MEILASDDKSRFFTLFLCILSIKKKKKSWSLPQTDRFLEFLEKLKTWRCIYQRCYFTNFCLPRSLALFCCRRNSGVGKLRDLLPGGSYSKESTCQYRKPRFDPWVGKIPRRRKWQPAPVFLQSHGQRGLAGYSPRGCKELDTLCKFRAGTELASKARAERLLGSLPAPSTPQVETAVDNPGK